MIHIKTQLIISSLILFSIRDGESELSNEDKSYLLQICEKDVNNLCGGNKDSLECLQYLCTNSLYTDIVKNNHSQNYFVHLAKFTKLDDVKSIEDYCNDLFMDQAIGIKNCIQILKSDFWMNTITYTLKSLVQNNQQYLFEYAFYYMKKETIQNTEAKYKEAITELLKECKMAIKNETARYIEATTELLEIYIEEPTKHIDDKHQTIMTGNKYQTLMTDYEALTKLVAEYKLIANKAKTIILELYVNDLGKTYDEYFEALTKLIDEKGLNNKNDEYKDAITKLLEEYIETILKIIEKLYEKILNEDEHQILMTDYETITKLIGDAALMKLNDKYKNKHRRHYEKNKNTLEEIIKKNKKRLTNILEKNQNEREIKKDKYENARKVLQYNFTHQFVFKNYDKLRRIHGIDSILLKNYLEARSHFQNKYISDQKRLDDKYEKEQKKFDNKYYEIITKLIGKAALKKFNEKYEKKQGILDDNYIKAITKLIKKNNNVVTKFLAITKQYFLNICTHIKLKNKTLVKSEWCQKIINDYRDVLILSNGNYIVID